MKIVITRTRDVRLYMCTRECVRETSILVASESHEQTRNRRRLDNSSIRHSVSKVLVGRGSPFSDVLELIIAVFSDCKVNGRLLHKRMRWSRNSLVSVATDGILYSKLETSAKGIYAV